MTAKSKSKRAKSKGRKLESLGAERSEHEEQVRSRVVRFQSYAGEAKAHLRHGDCRKTFKAFTKAQLQRGELETHLRESRSRRLDRELVATLKHGDRMLATAQSSFTKVCVLSKASKAR